MAAMPVFMCNTCGNAVQSSDKPPANCPICDDERQFRHARRPDLDDARGAGEALVQRLARASSRACSSITTFPAFGIGQRAQLLRTPHGNILWDCISLCDAATVELIQGLGGIKKASRSRTRTNYSSMAEWRPRLGGVPIHLHDATSSGSCVTIRPSAPLEGRDERSFSGVTLIWRWAATIPAAWLLHGDKGAAGQGALLFGRHRSGRCRQQVGELHVELSRLRFRCRRRGRAQSCAS